MLQRRFSFAFLAVFTASCGGGGEPTCSADDLQCFLDELDVITIGGRFVDLVDVPEQEIPAPGNSSAPMFNATVGPVVLSSDSGTRIQLPWTNPVPGRPAHCFRFCSGGVCTDSRCDRGQGGSETEGTIEVFLYVNAGVKDGVASFDLDVIPIGAPANVEAIAELEAGGAAVAGNAVQFPAQIFPVVDNPGLGCPSVYDGTYIGMFAYEYATVADPLQTQTDSLQVQVTLSCLASIDGSTILEITGAQVSDPAFGCQQGCTPMLGSAAQMRAEPPTTPSNPSQVGEGLVILFPNGANIVTENGLGAMTISSDGRTLSSSLDPAITDKTWSAYGGDGTCFPVEDRGSCTLFDSGFNTKYTSWVLNQSAL